MEPVDRFTAATRYWHELADGRAQCDLCPLLVSSEMAERGLCFVRSRAGAQVVLTSYGRSSGFWVDPVEKKPLNHFLPGSAVLSFGTAGCNLACRFCQNWDISKSREFDTLSQEASPQAIASAAKTLGAASIAFTYNDPVPFMEFAIDCADAAHELGLRAIAVTAGYICAEPRAEMYAHMDAANIDLKAFSEGFYKHICGAKLGAVLDTLEYLRTETAVWLEITNLLVPDANDSDAEIDAMTSWVVGHLGADVPMHFTAFHPDFKMTDRPRTRRGTEPGPPNRPGQRGASRLHRERPRHRGEQHLLLGLRYPPVERDWFQVGEYRLTGDGHCQNCGTRCSGVYDGPAGTGARCRPVRISEALGGGLTPSGEARRCADER